MIPVAKIAIDDKGNKISFLFPGNGLYGLPLRQGLSPIPGFPGIDARPEQSREQLPGPVQCPLPPLRLIHTDVTPVRNLLQPIADNGIAGLLAAFPIVLLPIPALIVLYRLHTCLLYTSRCV